MMKEANSIGDKYDAANDAGAWFEAGFAFGWESVQHQGSGTEDQAQEQFEQVFDDDLTNLDRSEAVRFYDLGRAQGARAWLDRRDAGLTPKRA